MYFPIQVLKKHFDFEQPVLPNETEREDIVQTLRQLITPIIQCGQELQRGTAQLQLLLQNSPHESIKTVLPILEATVSDLLAYLQLIQTVLIERIRNQE
ncbi:MAG: hypothetical protein MUD01_14605 [Chloroflexaceae bacterium]|nr:hypothetical protein [Chloroflexaceae bacterium]